MYNNSKFFIQCIAYEFFFAVNCSVQDETTLLEFATALQEAPAPASAPASEGEAAAATANSSGSGSGEMGAAEGMEEVTEQTPPPSLAARVKNVVDCFIEIQVRRMENFCHLFKIGYPF